MQVVVNGASLYIEQRGSGPDLVLLHGIGVSSARVWQFVLPSLAEGYRVLVYDLRGFDRSANPSGTQTVTNHTADLIALLDKLGITKAHIAGFSFSGLMALELALEKPELVRSLILIGTSAGLPSRMRVFYQKRVEMVENDGMAAYAEYHSKEVFTSQFLTSHADTAAWYHDQFVSTNRNQEAYTGALLAMLDIRFQERLAELNCPVLLISGANDKSPMNSGSEHLGEIITLHRLIQRSELVIIPESGHYVQIDQPEAFTEAVQSFLERADQKN